MGSSPKWVKAERLSVSSEAQIYDFGCPHTNGILCLSAFPERHPLVILPGFGCRNVTRTVSL